MTYGWAILIIAVVLAALFELGVFNPMTFAPKASPGSCQVLRPEGAGTTDFISLSGECNGELPQYVAQFNGNGYISANILDLPVGGSSRTVSGWVTFSSIPNPIEAVFYGTTSAYEAFGIFVDPSGNCGNPSYSVTLDNWNCQGVASTNQASANQWVFFAATYNGTTMTMYQGINGKLSSNNLPAQMDTVSSIFTIGESAPGWSTDWLGYQSNIQVYNTALSANDIKALYQEGIGGAPIKIQSLVAWYPLNGNANDYSGNGNNGVPTGDVTYTSNWYSGYSAP